MFDLIHEKAFVTIPGQFPNRKIPYGKFPGSTTRLKAYSASVWEFACCRFLANSLVAIPWGFETDGSETPPDHPANELFNFVNEDDNFPETLRNTMIDFKLRGFAIWLPQVVFGRVIRFKHIPVSQVILDTLGDVIQGIWWNTHSTQVYIPWQHFVFFKDYASLHPVNFDSPASVTTDKAQVDQGIDANLNSFLESYSVPPWVFTSDQSLKEPELTRYSDFWNSTWSNIKNRFKAAFMGGGLTPTPLRSALKDLIFPDLKKDNRIEICAAYGVLPALVGAVSQVNRADRIEQIKMCYHTTIIPDSKYIAGVVNAWFRPFLYQNAEFYFYPERVELLQEERSAKSERIRSEVELGILNIDAAAQILGYSPYQIGQAVDRNIILDPQISAFKQDLQKAEWSRFRKKLTRSIEEDTLEDFEFHSKIIPAADLEKALSTVKMEFTK
jgi:phage portal protein BeeE